MQLLAGPAVGSVMRIARLALPGTSSLLLAVLLFAPADMAKTASLSPPLPPPGFDAPTVANSPYACALLYNALQYVRPEVKIIDPNSGFPVEGWNHEPQRKLDLRPFTQLTAIGQWLELQGNVIAGDFKVPWLSKEQALAHLTQTIDSLRADQHNPELSYKGLVSDFFDLSTRNRFAPLALSLEKQQLVEAFGAEKADGLWKAMRQKGWIKPHDGGEVADILRGSDYGLNHFDGPLSPYADLPTRKKLMALLDRHNLLVAFGDNANLSMSIGKTIGALLRAPGGDPRLAAIREKMEAFLAEQQPGYEFLYDKQVGLFYFGWDVGARHFFGWELEGRWHVGHTDYLVNEFRGPATFVVLRYGMPTAALANLGFHIKPYELSDGRTDYVLAPWEGSAFQGLGFSLSRAELDSPSWNRLLRNFIDVEIDYSNRHRLPGFLSESYTGVDAVYSGQVGMPELAVSKRPRITDAPSLYTLGVAFKIEPEKIEGFLRDHWAIISTLLTDHGPWEGYNVRLKQPITVQTSAHTFALILGLLGSGAENIAEYGRYKGLRTRLLTFYRPGKPADLLHGATQIYAWANSPKGVNSSRQKDSFAVATGRVKRLGIAFVAQAEEGMDLSGELLKIRYRSDRAIDPLLITFKPAAAHPSPDWISKQIRTRFVQPGQHQIEVLLPATPGLNHVKEVVLTHDWPEASEPMNLDITEFSAAPY